MSAARDHGAGSVLALGIVGAVVAALLGTTALVVVVQTERWVANAADQAALAAADTASGLVPGVPCDVAATVAEHDGGALERCAQQGDTVTVTVWRAALGMRVAVAARAGPPG